MLLHRSIGLDRFNAMPRSRAIHALYECCHHYTLATKLADARPYVSHAALSIQCTVEFEVLSPADQELVDCESASRRLSEMLGPVDGWPDRKSVV